MSHVSAHPRLTREVRKYISDRILLRYRQRQAIKQGVLILDLNVFEELVVQAFNDAETASLIERDMKQGCGMALMLDEDFYEDLRWQARFN